MSNPETELSAAIVKCLHDTGEAWLVRVPAGTYRGQSGGYVHVAEAGFPDLVCVWPTGLVEVKVGTSKLRASQKAWHAKAKRFGVRTAVVTSPAEMREIARRWKAEDEATERLRAEQRALEQTGMA